MKTVQLSEVCDITMGQAPKGDTYNESSAGLPLVAGAGDFGDVYPSPKKFTTARGVRASQPGDIVVGIRASIGDKVWADGVYCLGRGVVGLRAREDLDQAFLWHWVTYAAPRLAAKGRGATFLQVNKQDISEMEISLPPIEEQRRMAAVLDAADALRAKRRLMLARLDALTEAIFSDLFGDLAQSNFERVSFGGLFTQPLRNGISPSKAGRITASVLTLSAITGRVFDHSAVKESTFTRPHSDDKTVSVEDFLICRGNGNIGLVGRGKYPGADMRGVAFPDTMIAARCDERLIARGFLVHLWDRQLVRRQLESAARTTNGTYKINQTMIESVELPLPPIELQRQFDRSEAAIATQRVRQASSEHNLDALFVSLQQQVFRGEL